MARYEFPSRPPPPTTNEPAAGPRPPASGRTTRTDACPDSRPGADGPVGRGPTTWPCLAPEGAVRLAARYAQPGPRGTAPRVSQGRNNIHADAATQQLPSAETPWALVRYRSSGAMREPTCYFGSRELAVAAASILVDEPWTVVNALVTAQKRRPIDEMLQDLQDRRGVIQTPYPATGKRRDDLDDDEPLRGPKAPRDRRPANNPPWKTHGGVDAGRSETAFFSDLLSKIPPAAMTGTGTLTVTAVIGL